MEAQPITLPRSAVALETRHGVLDPTESLYVDSSVFESAVGCRPIANAGCGDSRYRVLLAVVGWEDLGGVYYVSGWLDEGLCGLNREAVLTRREAIRLKKRGYLSREGVDTAC